MVRLTASIRVAGIAIALLASSSMTASAQDAAQDYKMVLQQIADQKIQIAQREYFIARQGSQIEQLQSELEQVGPLTEGVDEIISKMAAQLEDAILSDVPFLRDERLARVEKIKADLELGTVPMSAIYRSALSAFKIEVDYGQSMESYIADRPLNDGENPILVDMMNTDDDGVKTPVMTAEGNVQQVPEFGSYIRYGRVALAYLSDDMLSARRYDMQERKWVEVTGAELVELRRAVRISKGEVAPGVVTVPTRLAGATN